MTRPLLAPDGTRWTVSPIPQSRHRKQPDPRVWLSFTSDGGTKRLQTAPPGFLVATATDAELLAILEQDPWGLVLPLRKQTAPPPEGDGAGPTRRP